MATVQTVLPRRAARTRNWPRLIRKMHLYLGTFFAPAIMFFATTGALQTFSWHEHTQGSSYEPPVWLEKLAQLHKKQTAVLPVRKPAGKSSHSGTATPRPEGQTRPSMPVGTLLQKVFVFWMGVGLVFTTALGLYMAFKFNPRTPAIWIVLAIGTALPVLFALL